jgi:predicted secreted protein
MNSVLAFLSNPTVRRLAIAGLTAAVVALNKKLALGLENVDVGALVTLALGYLLQSAATDRARIMADAQSAADAAAAAVKTVEDAAKVLEQPK